MLYVLTWTNKVAFKYDAATLTYQKTLSYPREGWGITTDGKQLIASDGSANLFFLDKDLKLLKRQPVTMNGRPTAAGSCPASCVKRIRMCSTALRWTRKGAFI